MSDERTVPDAAPVAGETSGEWVLGGEAAVPEGAYGPPIPSRFPTPQNTIAEIRQLERRMRARLTPLLPLEAPRKLPLRFLWSRYRKLAMRGRSDVVDDYGRDPAVVARATPILDLLFDHYFRARVEGAENLPTQGPAILVANHSGALPLDAAILMHAVQRHGGRSLRPLIEDFVYHAPYLGVLLARLGAVRACPDNADRLLSRSELVAVFPEGVKGPSKLYKKRYQLQRFGRGGFVRLALRAKVPIIPVAIVGAEESYPMLARVEKLTRSVGLPYLPVTPTFPWLGAFGLLPLPSRWQIHIGEPIDLAASHPGEAAEDRLLVGRLAADIRDRIQGMLATAISTRSSAFL